MKKKLVLLRDETLRDGCQQPGINLSFQERIEVARLSAQLLSSSEDTPNNIIDLGMPEVSKGMFKIIKSTVEELKNFKGIDLFVTGRATKEAIDSMCSSLSDVPRERKIIAPFIGVSKIHRKKIGVSKTEVLEKIEESIRYAQKFVSRIHFPLEGGYNAYLEDRDYIYKIFNLLEKLGVEAVVVCDTVGIALPFSYRRSISYGDIVSDLRKKFIKIKISAHCHDDLGLALANSIDGVINGASIVDGTFFGIGERAGNTSLQTLLVVLSEKEDVLGIRVQTNLDLLYGISQKIERILKVKFAANTPVVGKNTLVHASGIHQDGFLKDRKTYEPYSPEKYGRSGHRIALSYLSGKKGIDHILRHKYGVHLSDQELAFLVDKFKDKVGYGGDPQNELKKIVKEIIGKNASL